MTLPNEIHGSEGDQFNAYTTQPKIRLGQSLVFDDGRRFRFCSVGASVAAIAGFLYQSEVPTLNSGLAVATHAAGVTSLTVTFGGAVTLNEYADGFIWSDSNAGATTGMYKIKSHPAGTAVAVTLWVPTNEAILAATTVSAIKSPYKSVIIHPSPPTAMLVGVAVRDLAVSTYGWFQTHGPCAVNNVTTSVNAAIGKLVMASANTNGAVEGMTAAGDDEIPVGQCIEDEATTEFLGVFLTLE